MKKGIALAVGIFLISFFTLNAQEKSGPVPEKERAKKAEVKISRGKGKEIVNVVVDLEGDHSEVKVALEEDSGVVVIDVLENDSLDWIELKLLKAEKLRITGVVIGTFETNEKMFIANVGKQRFVLQSGPPLQQTHRNLVFRGEMTWSKAEGLLFHQFIDAEKKTKRVWKLETSEK